MNRKLVSTGLLAGLVAGTGAGLILQQTGFAGASNGVAAVVADDSTTVPAATDPVTTDAPAVVPATDAARPDRGARVREVLQPLVDDGTLTAAQLDAIVTALEAAGPNGGDMPGGMSDHGGPGGRGGMGDHGPGARGMGLEAAATALGMTADELRTELEGGSTIAAVATEKGVDVQTVITAIVADETARLTERVTAGDMTQAEADAKVAEITTRVTEMVNNVLPTRPVRPADAPAAPAAPAEQAPVATDAPTS